MTVAPYLLRFEPFTQIFLCLRDGHFDLAGRFFHSIKENLMSTSKNNMADVKELMVGLFFSYVYIKDKKLNYLIFYQLKRTNSRDFEPEFLASTKNSIWGKNKSLWSSFYNNGPKTIRLNLYA